MILSPPRHAVGLTGTAECWSPPLMSSQRYLRMETWVAGRGGPAIPPQPPPLPAPISPLMRDYETASTFFPPVYYKLHFSWNFIHCTLHVVHYFYAPVFSVALIICVCSFYTFFVMCIANIMIVIM